jgi:subtilisin family serine protease
MTTILTDTASDPIWSIPPVTIERQYDISEARAFAEIIPEHVKLKRGDELRDKYDQGKGIRILVGDTGISKFHTTSGDLQNAFRDARDFTGSRSGTEDKNGHGTHCCGIIAADTGDTGTSSIMGQCDLFMGKCLGDSGSGQSSWIAKVIDWGIELKVHVISLSLGGGYSQQVHEACKEAERLGIAVIAAAGNSGRSGVGFPAANNDSVDSIANCTFEYEIAPSSSRGPANDRTDFGTQVYSTYRDSYARLTGTSMACPGDAAVQGAIAALELKHLGQVKRRSLKERHAFCQRFIVDRGRAGHDSDWGHGTIDFAKMILTYEAELQQSEPDLWMWI